MYKRQGEDRLKERGSLPATFYILTRVFLMANDNSCKFKQNQIMFCICPQVVNDSRPIDFGEDRLMGRGSLPATFYILTRVKYLILINTVSEKKVIITHCRKVDEISVNENDS